MFALPVGNLFAWVKDWPNRSETGSREGLERSLREFGYQGDFVFYGDGRSALLDLLSNLPERHSGRMVVVLPAYTCGVVGGAVVAAGLIPRFVDNESSFSPNPSAGQYIQATREDTLAVIAVHTGGHSLDGVGDIREHCESTGCVLIEDAAQAFGLKLGDTLAGNIGHYGILSFGAGKQCPAGGGGVLICGDGQFVPPEPEWSPEVPTLQRLLEHLYRHGLYDRFYILFRSLEKLFSPPEAFNPDSMARVEKRPMNSFYAYAAVTAIRVFSKLQPAYMKTVARLGRFCEEQGVRVCESSPSVYSRFFVSFADEGRLQRLRERLIDLGFQFEDAYRPLNTREAYARVASEESRELPNAYAFSRHVTSLPVLACLNERVVAEVFQALRECSDKNSGRDARLVGRLFDDLATSYSIKPESYNARLKEKLLEKYIRKEDKVLEIGIANAVIASYAAGVGGRVLGVDISIDMLKKARELLRERGQEKQCLPLRMDAANLGCRDKTFDLVYCFATLAYLPDPDASLGEMMRVLKPGGFFIVDVSNPGCLMHRYWDRYYKSMGSFGQSGYSRSEFLEKMRQGGFDLIEEHPILFTDRWKHIRGISRLQFLNRIFHSSIETPDLDARLSRRFPSYAGRWFFVFRKQPEKF